MHRENLVWAESEDNMKNVIAIMSGVIVSLILFTLISFLVMKFNVEPYSSFGSGDFLKGDLYALQSRIVFINFFILFPLISFVAAGIVSCIAKNNEYILGVLSVIPLVVLSFDKSLVGIFGIVFVVLFASLGVALIRKIKK